MTSMRQCFNSIGGTRQRELRQGIVVPQNAKEEAFLVWKNTNRPRIDRYRPIYTYPRDQPTYPEARNQHQADLSRGRDAGPSRFEPPCRGRSPVDERHEHPRGRRPSAQPRREPNRLDWRRSPLRPTSTHQAHSQQPRRRSRSICPRRLQRNEATGERYSQAKGDLSRSETIGSKLLRGSPVPRHQGAGAIVTHRVHNPARRRSQSPSRSPPSPYREAQTSGAQINTSAKRNTVLTPRRQKAPTEKANGAYLSNVRNPMHVAQQTEPHETRQVPPEAQVIDRSPNTMVDVLLQSMEALRSSPILGPVEPDSPIPKDKFRTQLRQPNSTHDLGEVEMSTSSGSSIKDNDIPDELADGDLPDYWLLSDANGPQDWGRGGAS